LSLVADTLAFNLVEDMSILHMGILEKPPTIEFMLSERLHELDSPKLLKSYLLRSGFSKELRDQAEYSIAK
jgi:hypothetical protein